MSDARRTLLGMKALACSLVAFLALQPLDAQVQERGIVYVYADHFEADGIRFETAESLRTYLLAAPEDFKGTFLKDCAGRSRHREAQRVLVQSMQERRAARSGLGIRQGIVTLTGRGIYCS